MLEPFPRLGKAKVKFIAAWHCHLGSNGRSGAVQDDEVMMLADGDDVAKLLGEGQSWKLEFACTFAFYGSDPKDCKDQCRDWQARWCGLCPQERQQSRITWNAERCHYRSHSWIHRNLFTTYPSHFSWGCACLWFGPHLWCGLEL